MVTTAVLPLAADYSEAKTFTNEGLWRMDTLEPGDVWVRSASGDTWTYNDELVLSSENSASSVILGDNWTVRGTGVVWSSVYYANNPDITVTVSEDTVTVQTKTYDSIEGYGLNPEGRFIMSQYDKPVYVHGDSPIYATGATTIDGLGFVVHIEGNIDDGVTVVCTTVNNTTAISDFVVTNTTIHAVKNNSYVDLYRLEGITFDVSFTQTSDSSTHSGTASYSSYVVPYEVTASPDNPDTFKNMVRIVPLIALVALVAAAAGMIYFKGKE